MLGTGKVRCGSDGAVFLKMKIGDVKEKIVRPRAKWCRQCKKRRVRGHHFLCVKCGRKKHSYLRDFK